MKGRTTNSMENYTRAIHRENVCGQELIVYTRKVGGILENVSDYLTFNSELERILTLDCVRPERNNGYLKFIVNHKGSVTRFALHDLALGCYSGKIHFNTYLEDIESFMKEKRHYGYVIDHADNVVHNQTISNLSLMSESQNKAKGSTVIRFKLPHKVAVAVVDGKYRVVKCSPAQPTENIISMLAAFGITVDPEGIPVVPSLKFICDTPDALVGCLNFLSDIVIEGCDPVKDEKGRWRKEGEAWVAEIKNSLQAQNELRHMAESDFDIFIPGITEQTA